MGGLVQVLAALTVGTSCLVAADAKAMHHAFRVGWVSAVGLHTEAWPWALAAASGHELMKGHRSKRGVHVGPPVACQCVQFGEVHTEVCHMQELWRHRLGDLRCTGYHPSMAGMEGEGMEVESLFSLHHYSHILHHFYSGTLPFLFLWAYHLWMTIA